MSLSSGSNDVVDLDQFMRAAPRRRPPSGRRRGRREEMEMDHGCGPTTSCTQSSSDGEWPGPAAGDGGKQYSVDSGLSDGSQAPDEQRVVLRRGRRRMAAREQPSLLEMQEFRAECERALRDQQHQIARVAELCSRLAERRSNASSSSRSDHASSQCKTYKIIMRKLDELHRVYPPRSPRNAPPAIRAALCSSDSVSVVDKTIGTDDLRRTPNYDARGNVYPYRKNYTVMQTDRTDASAKKDTMQQQQFSACACARWLARLCGGYVRALAACLTAPAPAQHQA